jgi:hypothetical protein
MSSGPQPFPLKDRDWTRLAALAGLPEAARPELANILGMGEFLAGVDAASEPAHATRECLSELHRKAGALHDEIISACKIGEVLNALTFSRGSARKFPDLESAHQVLEIESGLMALAESAESIGDFESVRRALESESARIKDARRALNVLDHPGLTSLAVLNQRLDLPRLCLNKRPRP